MRRLRIGKPMQCASRRFARFGSPERRPPFAVDSVVHRWQRCTAELASGAPAEACALRHHVQYACDALSYAVLSQEMELEVKRVHAVAFASLANDHLPLLSEHIRTICQVTSTDLARAATVPQPSLRAALYIAHSANVRTD
jgi:hypothetical protein